MNLSVLTIVKDRPGHLAQLIEGLRRSRVPALELIIVDMGSRVPFVVKNMPFPVHVLRLDQAGMPLAAARNAAARAASGETLLFLDVDCIPMKALTGSIAALAGDYDALICAEVLYLGPEDARSDWDEGDLKTRATGHPVRRFPAHGFRVEENAGLFWSLVFAIRRARFSALGGFDEAFTGYGAEDTDFGFRAKQARLPLLFMGGAGAFHQYHAIFDPPLQHLADIVRNARLFYERWKFWPMEDWLAAFERMGLIARAGDTITLLRQPRNDETVQARVLPDKRPSKNGGLPRR
jgi:glycosyltransferase involved in cell wall biosynthesis